MIRWIAVAVALPAFVAAQPKPVYLDVEPADRTLTQKAYAVFARVCPGLTKLAPLVDRVIVADQAVVLGQEGQDRHWPISVSVEVKFRNLAVANAASMGLYIQDDYLFLLGGGSDPGILPMSEIGLRMCIPQFEGKFMPVPDLRFLVAWPSEVVWNRANPHAKLDSTVYPLGEGPPVPLSIPLHPR